MMKLNWKNALKQTAQTLALLLLMSLAVDFWRKPSTPLNAANQPFTTIKQAAPQTLAQLSEKQTLLVYFWGSWCGICKHTSPVINELHSDGVPVLGVALRSGSLKEVDDYLRNQGLKFDTINDENGALSRQWGIQVTPTMVLIKQGKVVHSTTGLASYWGLKTRLMLADWMG